MERICVRVNEACQMLGIGRTTLFMSDIPYIKWNNLRLYRIKDLDAYLKAHEKAGRAKRGGAA